jgi:hypothetical protein
LCSIISLSWYVIWCFHCLFLQSFYCLVLVLRNFCFISILFVHCNAGPTFYLILNFSRLLHFCKLCLVGVCV